MKNMNRTLATILALILVVVIATTVFAADAPRGKNFADADNNGICDNKTSNCPVSSSNCINNGVCDNQGTGSCTENNDGICDNRGNGYCTDSNDGICDNQGNGSCNSYGKQNSGHHGTQHKGNHHQ